MKEYVILIQNKTTVGGNLRDFSKGGVVHADYNGSTLSFAPITYTKKIFLSLDDAVSFAQTLGYDVTIYESSAVVKIKHEVTKINENRNRTPRQSH